jgi:hypothetical protein
MWGCWAFKLSFDVDSLVFLASFSQILGKILLSFLVTLVESHKMTMNSTTTEARDKISTDVESLD